MMKEYTIVMDPGKKQDPCGIQVWKMVPVMRREIPQLGINQQVLYYYDLIMQYSFTGKNYVDLGDFVWNLRNREGLANRNLFAFDCTGIGEGVKDILKAKGMTDILPLLFTSGGKVTEVYDVPTCRWGAKESALDFHILNEMHVPKADMVSAAIRLLESKRVRVAPQVPYADAFRKQLEGFTGKMNERGYVSTGNGPDVDHDEFVDCFMMFSFIVQYYNKNMALEEGDMHAPDEIAEMF